MYLPITYKTSLYLITWSMFAFQSYDPVTQQKRLILFLNADKGLKE